MSKAGMALMGVAAHAVLRTVANYDHTRFAGMRVRFTSPYPTDFTARVIEAMASEGIPVCAHAGLVPPKARLTGMRGFAKTAEEAKAVFRAVKDFEWHGVQIKAGDSFVSVQRMLQALALSSGAGSSARHALATGVIGGMLFATFLGLLLIPVFFVSVRRMLGDRMDEPSKEYLEEQGKPASR